MADPVGINQSALGSYNAQAADHSTAIVNVYGQPVQAAKISPEEIAAGQARHAQLPTDVVPPIATLPDASHMPYAANPHFVGREDDLKKLAQFLRAGTAVATGLGGIGKTQTAVEFVHRYGTYFRGGVFWLSFANAEGVPTEIAQCGQRMTLRLDYSALKLEDQVQLVRAAWESDLPRLLVFDNCEDEALFAAFRPVTGGSRVLVTSRREQWDASLNVQPVPVGVLSITASAALLRNLNPQLPATSDGVLRQIGEELGGLPLALHLAGSYLSEYQRVLTPQQLLADLQHAGEQAEKVLSGEFGSSPLVLPTRHDRNVFRTFQLSYSKLDEARVTDALALQLLACAARLAPGEPVPHGLLVATILPQNPSANERIQAEDSLARLTGLGLLETASAQPPAFRLHRLLQRFVWTVREALMADAQGRVERVVLTEAERLNATGLVKPLAALQPQLLYVTDTAVGLRRAALGTVAGNHFKSLGDYRRAEEYFKEALRIRHAALGETDADTAASLNDVGFVLKDMGRFAEAQGYFEQALQANRTVHGEQSLETAVSLDNLGLIHKDVDRYADAQDYFERALKIKLAIHGERHSSTVESLNNLGFMLLDRSLRASSGQKLYARARRYLEQALTINQAMHGAVSREAAVSFNSLGELLSRRGGDAEAARQHFERALTIRKQVLGDRDPETAESLNNLGRMLLVLKNYAEARQCFEQALAIREELVGENHLDTLSSARIQSNLGRVLSESTSTLYQARPLLEQSLQTLERILGPEHEETRAARQSLQSAQQQMNYWSHYWDGMSG
jgi:tetratricopeptide (TPR) repeat protein